VTATSTFDGGGPMRLLAHGVPLTLLLDLVAPPNAAEVYAREGGADASARTARRSGFPDASFGRSTATTT